MRQRSSGVLNVVASGRARWPRNSAEMDVESAPAVHCANGADTRCVCADRNDAADMGARDSEHTASPETARGNGRPGDLLYFVGSGTAGGRSPAGSRGLETTPGA